MRIFGGLKRERTKVIAERLLEVESYVWHLSRAVIAVLRSASEPESSDPGAIGEAMASADRVLQQDARYGALAGAGMSAWGTLDITGDSPSVLRQLAAIIQNAEKFKGSSRGMTSEGKALVDTHYRILAQLRSAVLRMADEHAPDARSEAVSDLGRMADELASQLEDARRVADVP